MVNLDEEIIDPHLETVEPNEVIRKLRQDILHGLHWYVALLGSVAPWDLTEETVQGRDYRYLIAGEAFDFMVLAERLCNAVADLIPEEERACFLFQNFQPVEVSQEEFKDYLGEKKYHQYLNFYYGIVVEESLQYAIEEEVRKERWASGLYKDKDNTNEVFRRIYGYSRTVMLSRFRKEKGYSLKKSIKMNELKEFIYWLFKHRLKQMDKARVASDTKKGLDWLRARSEVHPSVTQAVHTEAIDILSF